VEVVLLAFAFQVEVVREAFLGVVLAFLVAFPASAFQVVLVLVAFLEVVVLAFLAVGCPSVVLSFLVEEAYLAEVVLAFQVALVLVAFLEVVVLAVWVLVVAFLDHPLEA